MADRLTELPWGQLRESPLNPRKFFEADAVAELAASIRDKGVLQNLTARVSPHDPTLYEIISGARRFRAFGLLVQAGERSEEDELPVRVIADCDDLEFLRLATAENVARRDMTPLEEAEAFAGLIAAGDRTEDIAALVGKSQRFVQLRIDLVTKLAPIAQTALREGRISVEQARAIKAAPKGKQAEYVARASQDGWTAEQLKTVIQRLLIPKSAALFDLEDYAAHGGEWIEEDGKWFFGSLPQFNALQQSAIADKRKELEGRYAWVKVIDETKGGCHQPGLYLTDPKHPKAGAVICWNLSREVKIYEGLVDRSAVESEQKAAGAEAGSITRTHLMACRNAKGVLLQSAVAQNEDAAMMLAIIGMVGGDGIALDADWHHADDHVLAPDVAATLKEWADRIPEMLEFDPNDWRHPLRLKDRHSNPLLQADLWHELGTTPRHERQKLFAALVASRFGSFNYCNVGYGDAPLAHTVASGLGVVADPHNIDPQVLKTASRDMVVAAAAHLDLIEPGQPDQLEAWKQKPANDVRAAVADAASSTMLPGLRLPTMAFGNPIMVQGETQDWIKTGLSGDAKPKKKPTKAA